MDVQLKSPGNLKYKIRLLQEGFIVNSHWQQIMSYALLELFTCCFRWKGASDTLLELEYLCVGWEVERRHETTGRILCNILYGTDRQGSACLDSMCLMEANHNRQSIKLQKQCAGWRTT